MTLKRITCLFFAFALLCLGGCAQKTDGAPITPKGFETPEAAIKAFVERIAALDTEGALACFSTQRKAEFYNFAGHADRIQAFVPTSFGLPNEYDAYKVLNEQLFYSQVASQVRLMMLGLLMGDKMDYRGATVLSKLDMTGADLQKQLDPAPLAGLKLHRTDIIQPEMQSSEAYLKVAALNGANFGYTSSKEYIALCEFEGQKYVGGVTLVEYEDGWYIESLSSALAHIDIYSVVPVTEQQYLQMLEQ